MTNEKTKNTQMANNGSNQTQVVDEGNESADLISRANAAAERLEQANIELEKNLVRQQTIIIESKLGGRSDAGTPPIKIVELPEDYARRVMANDI